MKQIENVYKSFLQDCHEKNLRRKLIAIEPEKAGKIKVGGQTYLNFASNDYLGLKHHPKLLEQSRKYGEKYGAGAGASRLVTGNTPLFGEIEQKIASLKGKQAALVLASGYQANGTVLQALFDKTILKSSPTIVADKLNHASMHFGCAAAGIRQKRYRHLDADHAENLLSEAPADTPAFLLTETVFSMDGDIAPMKQLINIASKNQATLIADDAHGFGILGKEGRGLAEEADIIIGTFSKALGSFGAYVAASQTVIDYLIQRCGGLIYSTGLPPTTLGSINAAIDLLPELEAERKQVQRNAAFFRNEMNNIGWDTGKSETQIVPLIIGPAKEAMELSEYLKSENIWVTAIRPPTVPEGTARLRFTFTASQSEADIEYLVKLLKQYKKKRGPQS